MGTKTVTTCDVTGLVVDNRDDCFTVIHNVVMGVLELRYRGKTLGRSEVRCGGELVVHWNGFQEVMSGKRPAHSKRTETKQYVACRDNDAERARLVLAAEDAERDNNRAIAEGWPGEWRPTAENGGRGGPGDR